MNKLKLAFFGAPDFAARVLEQIIEDADLPVELKFVVTQPDKPAGRKQILTPTPVKVLAQKNNIPVFETLHVARNALHETDLVLLYAFGQFIPKEMLTLPRWGFWNIHPSLLPKYRNTSPIVYSLLLKDKETGTSLIQMDEKLDHGPIIDQQTYTILEKETRSDLENRLSDIGYKLFKKNIQLLIDGLIKKEEQNHQLRTYSRLLTKKDGYVPFAVFKKIVRDEKLAVNEIPPIIVEYLNKYKIPLESYVNLESYYLLFRALTPWPGIWTLIPLNGEEKRLKIVEMELKDSEPVITKVQLEGKGVVPFTVFISAHTIL